MKVTCSACGGTGQIGYFQGVSRFLLSWEECFQCSGTGYSESRDAGESGSLEDKPRDEGSDGNGEEESR